MIEITTHPKSIKEITTPVPTGFKLTFKNGNTISVQFGFGNYCSNRLESKPNCVNAEIAIWNEDGTLFRFDESRTEKGYCSPDEIAELIQIASTIEF